MLQDYYVISNEREFKRLFRPSRSAVSPTGLPAASQWRTAFW
jgi:hypothetical protein